MEQTFPLNTLGLAHQFIAAHIHNGDICIDATAGRGRDTAFLCSLVGETGKVMAMDIQSEAVESTRRLLAERNLSAEVVQDCHSHMANYAREGTVSGIMFNFGWLPGGDHHKFSHPETSIAAINAGLRLLKQDGVMSICIYYGKETGYVERDALLPFLRTIDNREYTVIIGDFANRDGEPPIPVFIIRHP